MKTLAILALAAFLTGCSTSNTITPTLVQIGVSTTVSYGVTKYPKVVPQLRIANEVICSAASGTNISPASLIAAIKAAEPNLSPEATILMNGALMLYIGVWNSYGQNAANNIPTLTIYLKATCDGINSGLGPVPLSMAGESETWPVLRSNK